MINKIQRRVLRKYSAREMGKKFLIKYDGCHMFGDHVEHPQSRTLPR